MRHVYMTNVKDETTFAEEAAAHFAKNPKHYSYSRKALQQGALLALRWGLDDDCVLVMKLGSDFEPTIYAQLVRAFQEKL